MWKGNRTSSSGGSARWSDRVALAVCTGERWRRRVAHEMDELFPTV